MNERQARFVKEYAADPNGTQAAIRAGYAVSSAKVTASRLLTKPNIQELLAVTERATAETLDLTHRYVLKGLMSIAENTEATQSARVRAYELLGKHQGMFTDRIEITQIPDQALLDEWVNQLEADVNRNRPSG
jgi:phage terminase small subunit